MSGTDYYVREESKGRTAKLLLIIVMLCWNNSILRQNHVFGKCLFGEVVHVQE